METKNISFEKGLARLEEIIKLLENGEIQLDKSLELFEEGVNLVKICGTQLDEAEKKISIIMKNGDSSYEKKPFGED